MIKQDTMRPIDVAVVLAFAFDETLKTATFSHVGEVLGVSASTAFMSVQRLQATGLLRPGSHEPNKRELLSFLEHGVKHAFPASMGREVRGVPTAHSGPALSGMIEDVAPVVWPDPEGVARGMGIAPLYPNATQLPSRSPKLYAALTLVDAMRVGQARERSAARSALMAGLGAQSAESV
jgi:hypothetical protein